jgi:alkaline phosphatase D
MFDPNSYPMFDRRKLLKGALGAGLLTSGLPIIASSPVHAQFKQNPFSLGVASGDPAADGFVLWTRLAPEPLEARGGMSVLPVTVTCEIATDPDLKQVIRSGSDVARIELGHSVHVEVEGLEPARDYFYRFRVGDTESRIGRARTLPVPGAEVAQLRFAAAGCQAWEGGYYAAWRGIADENFDMVFHYGDYIYEYAFITKDRLGRALPRLMPTDFPMCVTVTDYRRRYALYKSDPDLQAAQASCPFLSSFDDHEVADNWAAETDSRNTSADAFLFRRAAAFQAWYEHMPVRRSLMPRGPSLTAYRRFQVGNLANVSVLDTRQFRSKKPCGDGFKPNCAIVDDADRTMMGTQQEQWLAEGYRSTQTTGQVTWQVLAQQVLFAHLDWRSYPWVPESETPVVNLDSWDGANAARDRIMRAWADAQVKNPVVLTGDMHRGVALELNQDWRDPTSACVGVEFLATSISSGGSGSPVMSNANALHANNPHLKFISDQRGYHRHTVTPERWQADFRVVDQISTAGAPVSTAKSFVVEAGRPRLAEA